MLSPLKKKKKKKDKNSFLPTKPKSLLLPKPKWSQAGVLWCKTDAFYLLAAHPQYDGGWESSRLCNLRKRMQTDKTVRCVQEKTSSIGRRMDCKTARCLQRKTQTGRMNPVLRAILDTQIQNCSLLLAATKFSQMVKRSPGYSFTLHSFCCS